MRVLAIDYGKIRVGLAISDPTGLIARELPIFERKEGCLYNHLKEQIIKFDIKKIVVGMPSSLHDKNFVNQQCQAVLNFVDNLKTQVDLPVVTEDERFTSIIAKKVMKTVDHKSKQKVDSLSACFILQSYLDKIV